MSTPKPPEPTNDAVAATPAYVLGHTPFELERLAVQARLVDPITRRYFLAAGIEPGMRVLDVGSGAGDTAILLADIVGESGAVIGVDRSAAALTTAQRRVEERGLKNVAFHEGDPAGLPLDGGYDAVAGRYVLMFQPDPVELLHRVASLGRPGAPVVFHEPDWVGIRSEPRVPSWDACCRWIIQVVRASGADTDMGIRLHRTFVAAGLGPPTLSSTQHAAGPGTATELVRLMVDIVRTTLPAIERLGIARAIEIDIDNLAERIEAEMVALDAVVVGRSEMGAWARVGEGLTSSGN